MQPPVAAGASALLEFNHAPTAPRLQFPRTVCFINCALLGISNGVEGAVALDVLLHRGANFCARIPSGKIANCAAGECSKADTALNPPFSWRCCRLLVFAWARRAADTKSTCHMHKESSTCHMHKESSLRTPRTDTAALYCAVLLQS